MAKKKKQKQRKKKGGGAAEVPDGERVEPSKQAALSAEPATQTSGGAVRAKTKRERDSILNEVLSGFSISDSLPWDETYVITSKSTLDIPDVEDDLDRELKFYGQAQEAAKEARRMLGKLKIKNKRPPDYLAQMIKSDKHMEKIRQQLVFEKQKMKAFEERVKRSENKKHAKRLQAERAKDKARGKKAAIKEAGDEFRSQNAGEGGRGRGPRRDGRGGGGGRGKAVGQKRKAVKKKRPGSDARKKKRARS